MTDTFYNAVRDAHADLSAALGLARSAAKRARCARDRAELGGMQGYAAGVVRGAEMAAAVHDCDMAVCELQRALRRLAGANAEASLAGVE